MSGSVNKLSYKVPGNLRNGPVNECSYSLTVFVNRLF